MTLVSHSWITFLFVLFCSFNILLTDYGNDSVRPLVGAVYPGPENVCYPLPEQLSSDYTGWCKRNNPFAYRPTMLGELLPILPEDFQYTCTSNDSDANCKGIAGMRGIEINLLSLRLAALVLGLNDGRMFLMDLNMQKLYSIDSNETVHYPLKSFDVYGVYAASVGKSENLSGKYRINFYDLSKVNKPYLWYKEFPDGIEIVQSEMIFDYKTLTGFIVTLIHDLNAKPSNSLYLHFLSYPNQEKEFTWNIYTDVSKMSKTKFKTFRHHHNFANNAPLRIPELPFTELDVFQKLRNLIILYDDEVVRMLDFEPSIEKLDIFMYAKDLNGKRSLFFQVPQSNITSGEEITVAQIMGEQIRRPTNLNDYVTCSNVTYAPSQNAYLLITTNIRNTNVSNLYMFNLAEFASFDESKTTSDPFNPAQRPDNYDCSANQYWDKDNQKCQTPEEYIIPIIGKAIDIKTSFLDANDSMKNVKAYVKYPGDQDDVRFNTRYVCEFVKEFSISPPTKEREYEACLNETIKSSCEIDMINGRISNYLLRGFFYLYWQTQIFIAKDTNEVEIFTTALRFTSANRLLVKSINNIQTLGTIEDLFVSENYSLNVKHFRSACADKLLGPKLIDISQFTTTATSCVFGTYCPSLSQSLSYDNIPNGIFLNKPYSAFPCPPGYFCRDGVRIDCPPGFACGSFGLSVPQVCQRDDSMKTTCYQPSLSSKPDDCPAGFVCTTSFFAPVGVPPGFWLKKTKFNGTIDSVDGLRSCKSGDYCPFGREIIQSRNQTSDNDTSILCPSSLYCLNSSILVPNVCNVSFSDMDYCPPGTSTPGKCPSGYFCTRPDIKKPCAPSQYCPSGSFASSICPGGYFCSNPATKTRCPSGYYCRPGSIEPTKCSIIFAWFACPEGADDAKLVPLGLGINILLVVGFVLLNVLIAILVKLFRKRAITRTMKQVGNEKNSLLGGKVLQQKVTVDIGFDQLGLRLFNGKCVLNGVTGEIRHGELTAVMGTSGSGKTTFITTLSGRAYYGSILGKIYINGNRANLTSFNSIIGFVPQEDTMIRELTVEETLYFSAITRLGGVYSWSKISEIVDNVIDVLGLSRIRYSVIGDEETRGISGGERKRVNVGIELVAKPSIIFLDEPTSGLDSSKSKEVCQALQRIAETGLTVITVIHQPRHEIFEMFENLVLLGEGGKTVFIGKTESAIQYFETLGFKLPPNLNPADYLLDVTSGLIKSEKCSYKELPDIWDHYFATRTLPAEIDHYHTKIVSAPPDKFVKRALPKSQAGNPLSMFIIQFFTCIFRSVIQQLRDFRGIFIDSILVFISGLVLGIMFYGEKYEGPPPKEISDICPKELQEVCTLPQSDPIINVASMLILAMALTAAMSSLRTFGREKIIFQRESQAGLGTVAYFFAKDLALLPSTALAPFILLSLFYGFLSPRASFLEYYGILWITYWSTFGVGYIVSIVVQPHIAQLTSVVVIFVLNIVSGVTPTLKDFEDMTPPLSYAPTCSYLRYSKAVTYIIELRKYKDIYNIQRSLELIGYSLDEVNNDYLYTFLYGLLFRFLALFVLICFKPQSLFNTTRMYLRHFLSSLFSKFSLTKSNSSSSKLLSPSKSQNFQETNIEEEVDHLLSQNFGKSDEQNLLIGEEDDDNEDIGRNDLNHPTITGLDYTETDNIASSSSSRPSVPSSFDSQGFRPSQVVSKIEKREIESNHTKSEKYQDYGSINES